MFYCILFVISFYYILLICVLLYYIAPKLPHQHPNNNTSTTVTTHENRHQQVHDELEKWRSKCTNLEADLQKLYGEIETAINEKDKEISDLH